MTMWDDKTRQMNRQYMTDNIQWDDNDIDFRQDMTDNEKQQIMRYDKFQKWYNTTNVIDDNNNNDFQ